MEFTEEQIKILEDQIINKVVAPHVIIEMLLTGHKLSLNDLELARDSLNELVEWIRNLRKKGVSYA